MRIIVVGQGPFGEKVLEALIQRGEEVVGVFCPPDKRGDLPAVVAGKSRHSSLSSGPDEGSPGLSSLRASEAGSR